MLDKILIQKNWISAILAGKVLLLLALSWLIYDRIWVQQVETGYIDHFLAALSNGKLVWLALCVVLAPINWTLEVVKWKKLTTLFQQISWQKHHSPSWRVLPLACLPQAASVNMGPTASLCGGTQEFYPLCTFCG